MSPSLRIATASRPAPSIFTDDGSAGRTLSLAAAAILLSLLTALLALRGEITAAVPGAAAAAVAAVLFSIHRKRRLFTSATLWLLRNENGSIRGWIESGLRDLPVDGFVVRFRDTEITIPAAQVLRRGDTWIIPLAIATLPEGRFRLSYRIAGTHRDAGRFEVDSARLRTL